MTFALFMLAALLFTGGVWLLDVLWLKKRRAPGKSEPAVVEYSKSFFPIILIVFLIRSFLVEPFKIPSGSMMPTLLAGDFILVNKFTYGLRVPIRNNVFIEIGHPQRGDMVVFRYPKDPSLDYIKRVIGVPGDHIAYRNKQIFINGAAVPQTAIGRYSYDAPGLNRIVAARHREQMGSRTYDILVMDEVAAIDGEAIVPEGHYFVMGDNRDSSNDSRYWGFVPEDNLVGEAFLIWWNFDNFGRIGKTIN